MFIITPLTAITIGALISPLLFTLAAFLTHAPSKTITAALCAAIAYGLANAGWDQVAFHMGWWSYPAFTSSTLLWLLYVFSGLVAGGAFGLVGWKIFHRYGPKGLIWFLVLWSAWGCLHDYGGGRLFESSNLMRFGGGLIPVIADALLYAFCGALAQLVIRLIGGLEKKESVTTVR